MDEILAIDPTISSDSKPDRHNAVQGKFVTIKVKKLIYCGHEVVAIFVNDVSKKIQEKVRKMQLQEKRLKNLQVSSLNDTVDQYLHTPLLSAIFFLGHVVKFLSMPILANQNGIQ